MHELINADKHWLPWFNEVRTRQGDIKRAVHLRASSCKWIWATDSIAIALAGDARPLAPGDGFFMIDGYHLLADSSQLKFQRQLSFTTTSFPFWAFFPHAVPHLKMEIRIIPASSSEALRSPDSWALELRFSADRRILAEVVTMLPSDKGLISSILLLLLPYRCFQPRDGLIWCLLWFVRVMVWRGKMSFKVFLWTRMDNKLFKYSCCVSAFSFKECVNENTVWVKYI